MMESEGRLRTHETNPFLQALARALYFLLMRHFPGDNSLRGNGPRMDFFKIAEYISAHLAAPLTVQSIAKALYIPRGRLTSVFTQYAGISPLEYIHSLRIQKANALMDQGRTVTDAALESGFQCIRTFNSTYKRLTRIPLRNICRTNTDFLHAFWAACQEGQVVFFHINLQKG